jgi:pilus assembly protein TadC
MHLVVLSRFTYTLETLIQAGSSDLTVAHVPVTRQAVSRPSRLFTSDWDYLKKSGGAIFRLYAFYRPLRLFTTVAVVFALAGLAAWVPFLSSWVSGRPGGHLQSLLLGAVLLLASVQLFALGIAADLMAKQRTLTQQTLERVRRMESHIGLPPSHYTHG